MQVLQVLQKKYKYICYFQLLVGSDDYEIREFKDDIIVNEISETSSICSLISLSIGRFAYALDNGTVGVYDKFRRMWRVKVKINNNQYLPIRPNRSFIFFHGHQELHLLLI